MSLRDCAPKIYAKLEKNYYKAGQTGAPSRYSLISTDQSEEDGKSLMSSREIVPLNQEKIKETDLVAQNEAENAKSKGKMSKKQRFKKVENINKITEKLMGSIFKGNHSQNK